MLTTDRMHFHPCQNTLNVKNVRVSRFRYFDAVVIHANFRKHWTNSDNYGMRFATCKAKAAKVSIVKLVGK